MRKQWTTEEIDYLKENVGFRKLTIIAKTMDRSDGSIRVKMNRLGISNTKLQLGFLTVGELAKILKVDRNTIKRWIEKYDLPHKKKVTRNIKKFYFINPPDFWLWAEKHKEKIQFSSIESLLLLPEPDWVNDEKRKERQIAKKKNYQYWTTKEDQRLLKLRKEGFTYKEIGERMNRSSISIARRYKRIK